MHGQGKPMSLKLILLVAACLASDIKVSSSVGQSDVQLICTENGGFRCNHTV